jgi:hypothetical protein
MYILFNKLYKYKKCCNKNYIKNDLLIDYLFVFFFIKNILKQKMSEKKEFDLESTDKTKLKFTLSIQNNTIVIESNGIDNKTLKYDGTFMKEELDKVSKVFKMDETIESALLVLSWCFEDKKVIVDKLEKSLDLTFAPKAFYLEDFHLSLKQLSIIEAVDKIGKQVFNTDLGAKIEEGKQKIEDKINKGISGIKNFFGV